MPFSATTSSSSFTVFASRRILLHRPLHQSTFPSSPPPASATSHNSENGFDVNVIMVLSVLLCALVCSLGLNSIIRCALRCSSLVASQSGEQSSVRLANTGVKKKALKTFPTIVYAAGLKLPNLDTECVICLSEFVTGERVRILPKCNHGFHVRCIDRWLRSHSSCPTCRQCLLQTCQKIVGCSSSTSSEAPRTVVQETIVMCQLPQPQVSAAPPQETVVRIAALEPEGLLLSYGL